MPRNGSGSYSLPEAPFVPLTTISSAAMNSDLSDIGTALTGSLARDGQGGMTAVLPLNAAGFSYTNDTNTGMYRSGSDAQAIKCGGTDIVSITTSGADVTGDISASGSVKQSGITLIPIGLGPLPWSRIAAPSGWVFVGKLYSRTTYSALWAVAQAEIALGSTFYTNGDGSTTFGVGLNMPGRIPACNDSISGSAAGTLTQAVFGSDPAVIGNSGATQTVTLSQNNLPNTQLAVSGSVTITNGSNFIAPTGSSTPSSINGGPDGNVFTTGQFSTISLTGALSGALTASMNGNVPQQALSRLQPTIITNYIVYAGA